jgi:STE24 endopeptidase
VAGAVFLVAPVLLRYIWHTTSLPAGELRSRLDGLCRRIGLSYRDILIWHSDGMVVNAAVMGLIRPVRYVLLSDGLLETMDDDKIEAVFGHEAGHVKHHHITFYLLFAILSMLVVGGISELVVRFGPDLMQQAGRAESLRDSQAQVRDYLQVMAMVMIVAIWGIGFGPVSRRFEWQADLFGARSVTPDIASCDRPCLVHGTLDPQPLNPGYRPPPGLVVCATAAHTFGEALHRIATLNGIPVEARSWRHSSIGNRIRLLRQYAADPSAIARLNRGVLTIKIVLVLGSAVGLAIGAWLYWPEQLVRTLRAWYGA